MVIPAGGLVHDHHEAAADMAAFTDAVRFCDLGERIDAFDGQPEAALPDQVANAVERMKGMAVGAAAEQHAVPLRPREIGKLDDMGRTAGKRDEVRQGAGLPGQARQ